jgi:predicted NAD/FAD-dependent oxidoreductase
LTSKGRFAVIGAGIAGLACARALQSAGAAVTVFERDPFPSGRAATWIDEAGPFDHGAQYFTARNPQFAAAVQGWLADGVVQRWEGRIVAFDGGLVIDKTDSAERFVAVPGMRRLGLHLAQSLDLRCATPIARLRHGGSGWHLHGPQATEDFGPFDAVLTALPSPLAADLLDGLTDLAEQARKVNWDPCWAATIALAHHSSAEFDGAFVNDDPILGWIARDSAKPRRGKVAGVAERWVLHARPAWSARYAELEPLEALRWLVRSFSARLRTNFHPAHARAHLWPHAMPANLLGQRFLWDESRRLGMAGDWCNGPRIEGAYLSGIALADAALQ